MNFRIILFSVVFLCSPFFVAAQPDAYNIYISKDGSDCPPGVNSCMKIKLVDSATLRCSFEEYTDGILKSKGYYLHDTFAHKTGTHIGYYKNGNIEWQGTYFFDEDRKTIQPIKINTWFNFYENGNFELEMFYVFDTIKFNSKGYLINFWDTAGNEKVVDGNGDYTYKKKSPLAHTSMGEIIFSGKVRGGLLDGLWKGYYADGTLFCEETYTTEGLIKGKSYDRNGIGYSYNQTETIPVYEGGDAALIRFIQKNMLYPSASRKLNVQGKVLIRFLVDKTGKVKDPVVMRSVSFNLDEEALRVVRKIPGFKPATFYGQPVEIYYNLPIVFKLR